MKSASEAARQLRVSGQDPRVVEHLQTVAKAFIELQQQRQAADYDSSQKWSRTQTLELIDLADDAFRRWRAIRNEGVAQDYLVDFLVKRR
jgi:hypothetical protein